MAKKNNSETAVVEETNQESSTTSGDSTQSTKKKRPPAREPNNLNVDVGRDSIKQMIFNLEGKLLEFQKVSSVFCQTEHLKNVEGAFTLGFKNSETKKVETQYWVVGNKAGDEDKSFRFSDRSDYKETFFPIGLLGGLSSFSCLDSIAYETGKKTLRKNLKLRLYVLSLADKNKLANKLKPYKWIECDGVRYYLTFTSAVYGDREGFGGAIYGFRTVGRSSHGYVTVGDLGGGTYNVARYRLNGFRPKESFADMNGGGGIISLAKELMDVARNSDLVEAMKLPQAVNVIKKASWEDEQIKAQLMDGTDCSIELGKAITNWSANAPVSAALTKMLEFGQTDKLVLVGGGMEIPLIREFVKKRLLEGGLPSDNLLIPDNPSKTSLLEVQNLDSKFEKVKLNGRSN